MSITKFQYEAMVLTVFLSLLQEYKEVVVAGGTTKDELLNLAKEIVDLAIAP